MVCIRRPAFLFFPPYLLKLFQKTFAKPIWGTLVTVQMLILRHLCAIYSCFLAVHRGLYTWWPRLISWCFEPSQPLGVTSRQNTTSNQSPSYSAYKSLNIDLNISKHNNFKHTQNSTFLENHMMTKGLYTLWPDAEYQTEYLLRLPWPSDWHKICTKSRYHYFLPVQLTSAKECPFFFFGERGGGGVSLAVQVSGFYDRCAAAKWDFHQPGGLIHNEAFYHRQSHLRKSVAIKRKTAIGAQFIRHIY